MIGRAAHSENPAGQILLHEVGWLSSERGGNSWFGVFCSHLIMGEGEKGGLER